MSLLEKQLRQFDDELSKPETKEQILARCVYDRLSNILDVQAKCLDESLDAVQCAINVLDLHDPHSLKQFNKLFKNLYHFMGIDRHKMITDLIQIYNL